MGCLISKMVHIMKIMRNKDTQGVYKEYIGGGVSIITTRNKKKTILMAILIAMVSRDKKIPP